MRFIKTQNKYKASNVELDLNKMEATSYDWWLFLKVINGKLVFNDHPYSISTQRHQSKVLDVLRDKSINPDVVINLRTSLCEITPDRLDNIILSRKEDITKFAQSMRSKKLRKNSKEFKILDDLVDSYQTLLKNRIDIYGPY